ncbi:hypothetical protein FEM48_Zijuj01G0318800 [Ziziphus jujuba var. spinosa]|uniref:Uncharacterized protein n=1 Tax=Ziziphus jujuba var. spinosa TaxID=714518 RepID=A0A978W6D8_ZIZJJ|nr:hypothetical protein FEM48_Zijuj01G0318800 [Ziziphus jujuba var. spinosa]
MSDPNSSNDNSHKKNDSPAIGFHVQDNSLITLERLDGTNYVEWSLNSQNKIHGRKCWGFILGTKAAPKDEHLEEYETWQDENCLLDDIDDCTMECTSDITKYTAKVNAQRVTFKSRGRLDVVEKVANCTIWKMDFNIPEKDKLIWYFVCQTCVLAKSHCAIFHLSENKEIVPFALVRSDVWGPAPSSTLNGMRWYVTFVDDCTRMTWVYLMKTKSDKNEGDTTGDTALDDGNVELELQEDPLIDSTISLESPHQPHQSSLKAPSIEVSTNSTPPIIDDVNIEIHNYHLPPRSNRGIPPTRYEPNLKAKTRYPIGNHVSYHRLSKSYASYVLQLSSISIPSKLQEALADTKWIQAVAEEMTALEKNATWDLVPLPDGKKIILIEISGDRIGLLQYVERKESGKLPGHFLVYGSLSSTVGPKVARLRCFKKPQQTILVLSMCGP